jgi:hypothetical protein
MSQNLCHYSCLAFRVVSFDSAGTQKLAVLLFCEATKTNLFVLDSGETSLNSSSVVSV